MNDYDMTIHTNPDARAWSKFFVEKYKVWSEDGVESDTEAFDDSADNLTTYYTQILQDAEKITN